MDDGQFDRLAQLLGYAIDRRAGLRRLLTLRASLALGAVVSNGDVNAKTHRKARHRRQDREVTVQGPCGNGGGKANACKRHGQCCTGYCHKGRCRCKKPRQSCTADRTCCPGSTGRTCQDGTCQPAAATCDVCPSGCPFSSLQTAVDAATAGDTITLCAGTYVGLAAIANIEKDLTIIGAGDGADATTNTILDGDGELAVPNGVLRITNGRLVSLRGLRIMGGVKGGVYNEGMLTMANCTVIGNTSGDIGGIFSNGPLTMTDCTVSENTGHSSNAGGVRISDAFSLTRCTIRENRGGLGGLFVQGTGTLTETTITDNTGLIATLAGGLYADLGTTTLIDSTISGNTPRNCLATNMGTITGPGCAP